MSGKKGAFHPRKYSVNDCYFDEIDSEEKAYILGFLCADGYLMTNICQLGIDLHPQDEEILHRIKKCMSLESPVKNGSTKCGYTMRRLIWTSRPMHAKLISYGIKPRKSYNLSNLSVKIPPKMYRHFFRGYFDGDGGWVWGLTGNKNEKSYRRRLTFSIRATPDFCYYLQSLCIINLNYTFSKTGVLKSSRELISYLLGRWLYDKSTIYLTRKYNKFMEKTRECPLPSNWESLLNSENKISLIDLELLKNQDNKGQANKLVQPERLNTKTLIE